MTTNESNFFSNDNLTSFNANNLPYSQQTTPPNGNNAPYRGEQSQQQPQQQQQPSFKSSLPNLANITSNFGNMNWPEVIRECRNSRRLVLLVVFIALFFDNMLLTTVGNKYNPLFSLYIN
jgi:hypothetical protein